MAATSSVIDLSPASKAFVANRANSLGAWVIAGFLDAILMGIVMCQVGAFFQLSRRSQEGFGRHYHWLVALVTFLSLVKTGQSIAIVWVQNVSDFMNPDVARTLVATAWWQVTAPLLTAIIGFVVQSFFALRFYMLARNIFMILPIACSMLLGFGGACLQLNSIIVGNAKAKVMWLLVHLICSFMTDFMITVGTIYALRTRTSSGLASTISLISRLMRLVFESAIPSTLVAAVDLIMSQTLDANHLLWHLLLNYALAKLYAISLLYTLNCVKEYRYSRSLSGGHAQSLSGGRVPSSGTPGTDRKRGDVELGDRSNSNHVYIQTQVVTHVSPSQGSVEAEDLKHSGWQPDTWTKQLSDGVRRAVVE
ncbi:hypothetical protein B0H16DRAFT_1720555 [Mycena metata]|uniref:DUF6534 domain-containing protein n=1 Tax=Mycena metata TaxID=1033252 RepID=A0AAD7JBH0_9AGAR|nr:hypothetical protein B0H16DRAFT_1720555 [Mycena metata]